MPPRPQQDTAPFALPDHLAAKNDPSLIDRDRIHFRAIATSLEHAIADLEASLAEARRTTVRYGTAALERDQEVHRLTARLRALRRYDLDLCLGRIVHEGSEGDEDATTYVGRFGLADRDGRRLLVDWRSPAAEPFFAATHARPHGLVSRRRYRWTGGRIVDYWDEAFTQEGLSHTAALDDQSAFIATLGGSRTPRMRDVLGTIQSDQDAIVRAGSRGALVVDGGPGTGKTVVALHRTAYLLYADPRLGHHRGGVLFVGPHQPYLAYVSDVLPSLGEEGVQTCTVRDLVPEATLARSDTDDRVAALKADLRMVAAIEPAVALLDAARLRLGDPEESRRRRRTRAAEARERARMSEVVDDLRATARETGADEFGDGLVSMLVHDDLQTALVDHDALPSADVDLLTGPFAHVVVDEAQELTDAEWQMLLRRCPSRSFTIVGDRAQARHGFAESWTERLERVGVPEVTIAPLTINYRTPAEVMAEAEPVIRAALPGANVPTSIRESGIPVLHSPATDLDRIVGDWLAQHAEGTAVVIEGSRDERQGALLDQREAERQGALLDQRWGARVRRLTPVLAKGLEFDLVVLVDPDDFGSGIEGAVDRYVAMTRATQRLAILTS